jgi:8-oxo-dGTP pyrophosphatase MutT (NUDIX family)
MSGLPVKEYTSAGAIVIDSVGEHVLVLRRPGRMGPDGRPEVRLPKGHVETGESLPETALREVQEETGIHGLRILDSLGHQMVEFDWRGYHYVRQETYFLMGLLPSTNLGCPEPQFECVWLTWEQALVRLTFEAEREWVRRAQRAQDRQHPAPG